MMMTTHACSCVVTLFILCQLQMGAICWPFIQAVNFKFVPAKLRTIFVAVFSFFWTTGLSALKHNTSDHSDLDVLKYFGNKT